MKLSEKDAKFFEQQQEKYGTLMCLKNMQWSIAAELLHDIGVKTIHTSYFELKKKNTK